jgi:predicted RNA methylase
MASISNPITFRQKIKRWPGVQSMIDLNVAVEDWWFDLYHHVDTSAELEDQDALGWTTDSMNFHYLPIRPKCARRVLRNLPLKDPCEYTFIDFGSGKGRMLFIAARYGFRCVRGIELRKKLHQQALRNLRQCRHTCGAAIESVHMDAALYEFAAEKSVLFFFNPFGSEVMIRVLARLMDSLDRHFRDVWVVLHDPKYAHLADQAPRLNLEAARDGYRIYRSIPGV